MKIRGAARRDLFGRESRPSWFAYGDEATLFDAPAASPLPVLAPMTDSRLRILSAPERQRDHRAKITHEASS
jgi:hypothetical protein